MGARDLRVVQRETCSILQLPCLAVNTQLPSLCSDCKEGQLLPPSFLSSCRNKFHTGFSHHIGTLSSAPRCSPPFIWLQLWAVKFLSSPPPGMGMHIAQLFWPNTFLNYSSKRDPSVLELWHASSPLHVLQGYGQLSLENYLFETLRDWSVIAHNHLEQKTNRTVQLLTSVHWCISHIFIQGLTCSIITSIFHLTFMPLKIQLKGTPDTLFVLIKAEIQLHFGTQLVNGCCLWNSPSCLRATACAYSQVRPRETVGRGKEKKENAYAKFLKLKAVMKKVIELDETDFPYCLAIPH